MTQPALFDTEDFLKFEGIGTRRKDPAVSLQARGSISINAEGFKVFGQPEYVEMFYSPKRGQIMLKAADKTTPGAARVRGMRGDSRSTGGGMVASKAFFDAYGIDHKETRAAEIVLLEKGVLVVQAGAASNGE